MMRGSKTDEILTLIFMLLAIATIICFFAVSNRMPSLVCGGLAVALRLVQYLLRFIH